MPQSERSPMRSLASRVTNEITAFGPLICTGALIAGLIQKQYTVAVFFAVLAIDWCNYISPERMIGVYVLLALGIALSADVVYAVAALALVPVQFYRRLSVFERW